MWEPGPFLQWQTPLYRRDPNRRSMTDTDLRDEIYDRAPADVAPELYEVTNGGSN